MPNADQRHVEYRRGFVANYMDVIRLHIWGTGRLHSAERADSTTSHHRAGLT